MDNVIDREDLMEIYKNPTNKGTIPNPSSTVANSNPMCGDQINLQIHVENGKISNAKFTGSACSVSVISSDILLENIKGKTLEEVKNISKDDLLEMLGLNLSTSRVKCATLVLDTLKMAIEKYEGKQG